MADLVGVICAFSGYLVANLARKTVIDRMIDNTTFFVHPGVPMTLVPLFIIALAWYVLAKLRR